jgi:cytochrome c oxidase cbb3-type subunit 3
MSRFWNLWIAGLVAANIVYTLWLLRGTIRRKPGDEPAGPATTGHVWDGNLAEYNNPLPRWWLWLFYITIAFAIAYLVLFPGFGAFRGTLGWSQVSQWRTQKDEADAVTARAFSRFDGLSVAELSTRVDALKVARNLFAANCAMCHGSDARGAKGFPNLTSPNLSWGRDPDAILATIGGGRQGVMPAWKDALGPDGVEALANYVYSLSGGSAPPALIAAGKDRFATVCAACHGADGHGNTALGAPNLTDEYSIYGSSLAAIRETIANGRSARMPAHLDLLGAQKVKLLAAYVWSLAPPPSGAVPASAPPAAGPAAGAGS